MDMYMFMCIFLLWDASRYLCVIYIYIYMHCSFMFISSVEVWDVPYFLLRGYEHAVSRCSQSLFKINRPGWIVATPPNLTQKDSSARKMSLVQFDRVMYLIYIYTYNVLHILLYSMCIHINIHIYVQFAQNPRWKRHGSLGWFQRRRSKLHSIRPWRWHPNVAQHQASWS